MRHGVARVVYGAGSLSLSLYIINRVAPHCVDTLMMTLKRENTPDTFLGSILPVPRPRSGSLSALRSLAFLRSPVPPCAEAPVPLRARAAGVTV